MSYAAKIVAWSRKGGGESKAFRSGVANSFVWI